MPSQLIKKNFWGFILLLGCFQISFAQQAQLQFEPSSKDSLGKEVSVPELVITAEKNHFSLLSQLDLSLRPIQTSQEALRAVPGLFIAQHAGGGKAEQLFLRGFDLDHGTDISLQVDGLPVNMVSHAHGQAYADLHFLIPELIKNINYGKGPADADKGNFATAGFVHFQTADRLQENILNLGVGNYNQYRGLVMTNLFPEKSKHQAYLAGEYTFNQGFFEANQHLHRVNLFGKYNAWLSSKTRLKASIAYFSSSWDASGQIPGRAIEQGLITRWGSIDSTEGGQVSRKHIEASLQHLLNASTSLEAQAYAIQNQFNLFSNFTFFANDPINGDQIRQAENRIISGGKIQMKHFFEGKNIKLNSKVGIQLRHDEVRDNLLAHTLMRDSILAYRMLGDVRESNLSFFIQEQVNVARRWQLELGVRYDFLRGAYVDQLAENQRSVAIQGRLNPKAKLSFQATEKLNFFVKSGTGFHSNDSRLVRNRPSSRLMARAYGIDAGCLAKPFESLLIQLTAWRLDLEEEFVYVGDEGIVEPSGRSRRMGLELSARWQPISAVYADVDMTYSHARTKDDAPGSNLIPLAPLFTMTTGLTTRLNERFELSLRHRHLADRPANEDYRLIAIGYHLADAVVSYRWKRFEWKLSVENILNSDWREAQFETRSRLQNEIEPVSEIHFTPGSPRLLRLSFQLAF